MNKNNIAIRLTVYLAGLLIMTLGIAISIKSNLGVSPVSSIPYSVTCIWGMEMGKATILFHIGLVIIQIILLRRMFKIKNLLQIPVGIIFGYFTTFCNYLMTFLPTPDNFIVQILLMLISTVIMAIGIFIYVPADIMPLAGEGVMLAVTKITKLKFSTVKIIFDSSMVTISLIACLSLIHSLGSVGIGTVVSAILVGLNLKFITKKFSGIRDKILRASSSDVSISENPISELMKTDVYTIKEGTCLLDVLKFFEEKKISGAPVVEESGIITGFISDGDIMRFLSKEEPLFVTAKDIGGNVLNGKISELKLKKVDELCKKTIITANVSDSLQTVCHLLSENHLKKIPVMSEGKMIGIINASTITKYAIELMQNNIHIITNL